MEARLERVVENPTWTAIRQTEESLDKLEGRVAPLQAAWSSYVTQMTSAEDMVRVTTEGRAKVRELVSKIGDLRQRLFEQHPEDSSTARSSPTGTDASRDSNRATKPKVKLATLTIPPFDGQVLSYPEFRTTFKALTDLGYKCYHMSGTCFLNERAFRMNEW